MAAPPKEGGSFTPEDIAQMGQALELALRRVAREGGGVAGTPETELRRRLAALIYGEASNGRVEADRLARIAVRGLLLSSALMWST